MLATQLIGLSSLLIVPGTQHLRTKPAGSRRSAASMAEESKRMTVDVSDLGVTMSDLKAPLPTDAEVEASGSESVSRISPDNGCEWTETSKTIEATLTIRGLIGQPAGSLAVDLTSNTVTITAFGTAVWSCILNGNIDPGSGRATMDAEGMQPVVRLALDKAGVGERWGGLIKQIGEDSILQ